MILGTPTAQTSNFSDTVISAHNNENIIPERAGKFDPRELSFTDLITKALESEYAAFYQQPHDGDNCGNFIRRFPTGLLKNDDEKKYQKYICEHYDKASTVGSLPYPHIDVFCNKFGLIPMEIYISWSEARDAVGKKYYNDELIYRIMNLKEENESANKEALEGVNEVILSVQATCAIQTTTSIVLSEIQPSELADSNQYIKTGIPAIDRNFGGIGVDENVLFFGAPGNGKTLSLRILAMIMAIRGNIALMPSGEATPRKTAQVMASMISGYSWNDWRSAATLDDKTQRDAKMQQLIDMTAEGQGKLKDTGGDIIIPSIIKSMDDIEPYMYDKARRPNGIFLDGYNLLADDWQSGVSNAANLARFAVSHEVPIFWNTQGNRATMAGGIPKRGDIAGSKGYYDSASIVFSCFGLMIEDDDGRKFPAIGWHCLKMRDIGSISVPITIALSIDPVNNSINTYDISDSIDMDSVIDEIQVENELGWTVGLTKGDNGYGYFSEKKARRISEQMRIANEVNSAFEALSNPSLNLN